MIPTLLLSYYGGVPGYGMPVDRASLIGIGLIVLAGVVGFIVQVGMKRCMQEYSAEPAGLTGEQIAREMLDAHGLHDVQITHVQGQLTDHYNPGTRTVNLSDSVYSQASVAAAAVAAHECGHAIQHAQAYPWLGMRSSMVPLVNIGTHLGQWILIIGLIIAAAGNSTSVAWIGLALFSMSTLFTFVTLPVELNASHRALAWLRNSRHVSPAMHKHASSALRWAAMTYVAAALSSIAVLVYYILRLLALSSRDRR